MPPVLRYVSSGEALSEVLPVTPPTNESGKDEVRPHLTNWPGATPKQKRVWALNTILCDSRMLNDPRTQADLHACEDD
jgi:hypothetical protein